MADLSKIRALDCELSVRTSNLIRAAGMADASLQDVAEVVDKFPRRARKELREVIENVRSWPEHSLEEQMAIDADKLAKLREKVAELYELSPTCTNPYPAGGAWCLGFGQGASAGWDAAIKKVLELIDG